MLKKEIAYQKITKAMKEDPTLTVTSAAEKLKLEPRNYYLGRKAAKKATPKRKYERVLDTPKKSGKSDTQMLAVFGSPQQILDFAKEALS
jgi:hypothetical protein